MWIRIDRFKGNQQSGLAVDDHLRYASDGRGHDRRLTGHGFQVDDAERLIHGRTDEERRMAEETDEVGPRDPLVDPDDLVLRFTPDFFHLFRHLLTDLPGVGGACTEHNLDARVEPPNGMDKMDKAFLSGYTADEKEERFVRIDPV